MRHRITLYGFSAAERRALQFALEYPAAGEVGWQVVETLAESDFAVIDAESPAAVQAVARSHRVARAVFVGSISVPEAPIVVPRPLDPARIRRTLVRLMARHGASTAPDAEPAAFDDPDEIVVYEPRMLAHFAGLPTRPEELPPMPEPVAAAPVALPATERRVPPAPAPLPLQARIPMPATIAALDFPKLDDIALLPASRPDAEPEAPADKKAAARAAARRARISHTHTDPGQLENLRDVLVLDTDAKAAEQLRELLDLFGFRVHVAQHIAQAADVLSRHALVAAFVDVPMNGADQGDGVTLLQTIQDLPKLVGHPTPAVLLVSTQLRPSDRVRAQLAGVNMAILKPVSRGEVARALEACDVLLPADARRSV